MMYAHYDTDADIAWFPTGEADDVVSEPVPGGLRDYDRQTAGSTGPRSVAHRHGLLTAQRLCRGEMKIARVRGDDEAADLRSSWWPRQRVFNEVAFSASDCSRPHAAEAQQPAAISAPRSREHWPGRWGGSRLPFP